METIFAVVEAVRYTHTNNWRILDTDNGIVKGVVAWDIKTNDRIECNGVRERSPRDGRIEFSAKSILPAIPADPRALLQYAAIKTPGIGAAKEQAIWDAYGEAWEEHPELDGISGIREATRFAWQTTLRELETFAEQSKTISYLLHCGCSINLASVAWETWEIGTLGKVTENPYNLADLPHYGFLAVDRIRKGFGIADEDPRRMREAVVYAIKQHGEAGNTAVPINEVVEAVKCLVPWSEDGFDSALKSNVQAERVVIIEDGERVSLALKTHYDFEEAIYERYTR